MQSRFAKWFSLVGVAMVAAGICGCSPEKAYDAHGVVQELRSGGREVVIRHDAIGDYMDAMTMPFPAKDPAALSRLTPGDVVNFRLHVRPGESWVDGFVVLSNLPPTPPAPPEPAPVLNDPTGVSLYRDVPELKRGDVVPDYAFTNELGKTIHLRDYRGKVLAFNFIFTSCPLPDFCPRATDNFAATMRLLKERPAVPGNWRLLSLSFDPGRDTTAVLESYGKRHGYDPAYWTLATGSFDELQPLGTHFGLYFSRNVTPDKMNHNLRTVVLDTQGRVTEIFIGNAWTPEQLAEAVAKAFAAGP